MPASYTNPVNFNAMITATQKILDISPLGMTFTVLENDGDKTGASLYLHWELYPGCNMVDPLVHTHPNAIETYEILEGDMEFFIKDKWIPARKGDRLMVPKGVAHAFRNPTDKIVKVYNTHQPALEMEAYFEDVVKLLDKITENRSKDFRMNLKAKLYLGVLMGNYRNDIIAVKPPDVAVRFLGFIGRLMGIKV